MSNFNAVSRAIRCALVTGAAVASASTVPAHAADENISEVIVTGSRIPRANLTAPTAVTTIDAEAIRRSGLTNVADILRTVPSFGTSALSSSNSNFLTTSAGVNTLQLRNLEEDRTLVLVNGRRYVSGVAGKGAVDFNTIPIELVDRIEIITGGASAIYGSDALAGVINVILKDNYEGVGLSYQFGEATKGGNIENRVAFTAGSDFANDRGNAVVSVSFSQQKGMFARERANTRIDDIATCALTDEKSDCQIPTEPFYSSFSEYGNFIIPTTGDGFTVSNGVGPTGTVVPFDSDVYGFNRQAWRRYTVPTDRYLISTLLDYEMGAGIKAFAEATFAQTRTASAIEPFAHSNSDLSIDGISIDNPFVPAAIRQAAIDAGDDVIGYRRRLTEIGQRSDEATRNTYRFVVGLEGDIQNDYKWETYYAFGRMDDSQRGSGQFNVLNMREALNVTTVDGELACANPSARLEGCVPINLFGLGSISPAAANYIRAPTSRQAMTQQETFGVEIGGPMFELPAGPLAFASGLEWRRERAEDVPDVLTQQGLNGGNREPPTRGSFDVGEVFLELDVPLLKDLPLIHDLSVGAAYRYSDYSTVGTTDAYTGRISWSPVESLRFRGQYARAVRAPNVLELFAPGGEDFELVSDPCNGVDATTPGVVAANCRAIPAIAARIAQQGVFELTQDEIQGTGGFTNKGNANLNAEIADSWSFGVIFDHGLGSVGTMTVSVDYFQIKIENLIDTVNRQTSIDFCFEAATPNEFCSFLTRDTDGSTVQLGELTEVNSVFINEGTLETEGVDVSVLWRWSMDDWIAAIPGQVALRLNYTYLIDFTETKFGSEDDLVGETAYARNKAQTGLTYALGPWSGTWEWTFIDNAVPDKSSDLFDFKVGAYSVHDLQFAYDFGQNDALRAPFLGNLRAYVGINNVFEEDAPIILSGVPSNTLGTDTNAEVYDPVGRTWYAGLNVSF